MSERAYDLEAIVAAHRAAKAGGYWVRLSDMEYDAIAGTVLRGLLAEGEESREPETQEDDDLGFDGPTVGHCSKCGEVRTEFYTCRDGGETVAGGGP